MVYGPSRQVSGLSSSMAARRARSLARSSGAVSSESRWAAAMSTRRGAAVEVVGAGDAQDLQGVQAPRAGGHHADEGGAVVGVRDGAQALLQVPDLGRLEQAQAADDGVRDVLVPEPGHDGVAVLVLAVQDGDVVVAAARRRRRGGRRALVACVTFEVVPAKRNDERVVSARGGCGQDAVVGACLSGWRATRLRPRGLVPLAWNHPDTHRGRTSRTPDERIGGRPRQGPDGVDDGDGLVLGARATVELHGDAGGLVGPQALVRLEAGLVAPDQAVGGLDDVADGAEVLVDAEAAGAASNAECRTPRRRRSWRPGSGRWTGRRRPPPSRWRGGPGCDRGAR